MKSYKKHTEQARCRANRGKDVYYSTLDFLILLNGNFVSDRHRAIRVC